MAEAKSGSIWRGVGVGISLGLFVVSLAQPAVTEQFSSFGHMRNSEAVEHWGFDLFFLGWFYFAFACFFLLGNILALYFTSEGLLRAFLGAVATFGWFANPCYLMSLIFYKRVSSSMEWSIIASAIAVISACVIHWRLSAYNVQMHQGVNYWVAATLVLLLVQMTRTPEPELEPEAESEGEAGDEEAETEIGHGNGEPEEAGEAETKAGEDALEEEEKRQGRSEDPDEAK